MTDTATANDPLNIFAAPAAEDHSESSHVSSASNPFDPLGGASQSSSPSSASESTAEAAPLDLMSQISSWGAQNKDETTATAASSDEHPVPVSPTTNKNVMAKAANAIELSDDLVAQAHQEFEATEAKLAAFEKAQLGQEAQ